MPERPRSDLSLDEPLRVIFVQEARAHLAVLADPAAGAAAWRAAALGLGGAAAMVGQRPLVALLASLDEALGGGQPPPGPLLAELEELLRGLEQRGRKEAPRPAPPPREAPAGVPTRAPVPAGGGAAELLLEPPPEVDEAAVTLPLRALRTPALSGLDEDESRALREFFTVEAHERLDEVEAALTALEPPELGSDEVRAQAGAVLRAVHTLKGAAGTVGRATVVEAAHLLEEHVGRVRDQRARPTPTLLETLQALCELMRRLVDEIDELPEALERVQALSRRLTDIAAGVQGGGADVVVASGELVVPPSTLETPEQGWDMRIDRRRGERSVIRVEVDRVDALAQFVSELVIDRTRVERRSLEVRNVGRDVQASRLAVKQALGALRKDERPDPGLAELEARLHELEVRLADASTNLDRAVAGLTDDIASLRRTSSSLLTGLNRVRMTPVRWLMSRLGRPLRDLARRHGKKIELCTEGEDTELDKAMVEQVADPLLHLVRNAVAHGIEAPEVRRAAGKPEVGAVRVSARAQADHVYLEIGDDGAGIDGEAIRRGLVRRGLPPEQAQRLTEAQLCEAIFLSGFSTRESADDLAGRGIGLDVVRSTVSRLGGEVTVSSVRGRSTTFTIRLPLTAAITQALLFKLGGEVYAVPMANVVESALVIAPALAADGAAGLPRLELRDGERVLLLPLDRLLGIREKGLPAPAALAGRDAVGRPLAVVLTHGPARFAIAVDKVIGPREIAVRRLGQLLAPLRFYAGATISGAGKVQLILDVATLAGHAQRLESQPGLLAGTDAEDGRDGRGAGRDGRRVEVLLVDDSRSVREALTRALTDAGFLVQDAVDGAEAWELLEDRAFDLVVTDLEMPRLHGLDLIARLRRGGRHGALPVIAMSSRAAAAAAARAAGAVEFLAKPVVRRQLLDAVRRVLGQRA